MSRVKTAMVVDVSDLYIADIDSSSNTRYPTLLSLSSPSESHRAEACQAGAFCGTTAWTFLHLHSLSFALKVLYDPVMAL